MIKLEWVTKIPLCLPNDSNDSREGLWGPPLPPADGSCLVSPRESRKPHCRRPGPLRFRLAWAFILPVFFAVSSVYNRLFLLLNIRLGIFCSYPRFLLHVSRSAIFLVFSVGFGVQCALYWFSTLHEAFLIRFIQCGDCCDCNSFPIFSLVQH